MKWNKLKTVNGKYKGGGMKKKVNIIGLVFKNPQIVRVNVGETVILEGDLVEKITYEEHCYNKGRQGKFPVYVVFFVNSNVRHVIKETEISVVVVEVEEIEDEQVPELPEEPDEVKVQEQPEAPVKLI